MATTPNYSLSIYDSSDTDVRFLDFRVAIAGTQTTSNFYVIDGALKEHSDAINTLKNSPQAYIVKANFASGVYNASVSGFPGYKTNQLIVLSLNQTNTGAVSININNSSAKNVMLYNANGILRNFIAGEFVSNSPALCYYDGTQFVTIGIPRGSATYVDGERGDVLQISSDGAIESSGKQIGNPNGIATLDSDGKVEQVAKIADGAASGEAVYGGNVIEIPYVSENRIASITAYGENAQGGTTDAPVALTGVDSVQVCGKNMLPNKAKTNTVAGITYTVNPDKSVTAKGTATSWSNIVIDADFSLPAGTYTLNSNIQTAGVSLVIGKDTSGKKNIAVSSTASKTFTLSDSIKHCVAYIAVAPDSVVDTIIRPMLNLGNTAMPYEPYQGSVTQLPIPRALHEVGDVRDICRTRVKSVYDKRIVLSSADGFTFSNNAGNGYARFYKAYNSARLSPIASDWLPGYAKTAYNATNEGVYSADSDAGAISIVLSIKRLTAAGATSGDTSTYLTAASAIFAATPLTVYYQSTDYNGTNGLDVMESTYNVGFLELDGTEDVVFDTYGNTQKRIRFDLDRNAIARYALKFSHGNPGDTPTVTGGISASFNRDVLNRLQIICSPDTWTALGVTDTATAKTWLAAQKAAGTPVQVAYQLATPEVYATDPVDFDNAAGPLIIMTGGELEVKLNDFISPGSPEFENKLNKDGDGSNITVTLSSSSSTGAITSGDTLSTIAYKTKSNLSDIELDISQINSTVSDIVDGTTPVAKATQATQDSLGEAINTTYASALDVSGNNLVLENKSGTALSTITVPYATKANDVNNIKNMSIAVQTTGAYAWFLNYTGTGNKDGARKYYAAAIADSASYADSAGSARASNISMSLSGTNLSISYS